MISLSYMRLDLLYCGNCGSEPCSIDRTYILKNLTFVISVLDKIFFFFFKKCTRDGRNGVLKFPAPLNTTKYILKPHNVDFCSQEDWPEVSKV